MPAAADARRPLVQVGFASDKLVREYTVSFRLPQGVTYIQRGDGKHVLTGKRRACINGRRCRVVFGRASCRGTNPRRALAGCLFFSYMIKRERTRAGLYVGRFRDRSHPGPPARDSIIVINPSLRLRTGRLRSYQGVMFDGAPFKRSVMRYLAQSMKIRWK